jgi:hypothetical protein
MPGVAPPQVLANKLVGALPKAGQVIGHLLGPAVGCAEVQQQPDSAARNTRGLLPAEKVSDGRSQNGRTARLIDQADCGLVGQGKALGRLGL